MQEIKIRRRLFVAGALASTALSGVVAQAMTQPDDFQQRYRALLARFAVAHPGVVRDVSYVSLPGSARPWLDTDITVASGDSLSFLCTGQVFLSRAANLGLLPRVALWARIGDAEIFRPGSDTYSLQAADGGPLRLATLQGRWSSRAGDHPMPAAYDAIEGAIDVLMIRWGDVGVQEAIEHLAAFAPDDALIAAEHRRLRARRLQPRGFEPLWYVGSGDNFAHVEFDGEPAIALRSELNGGIIRAPLDLSIDEGISLAWDWRINQLPSVRAENVTPSHQYASIAVEFDDGQDLSWYWSATLEPERHYRCPFPSWPGETHLVVRSGSDGQGRWISERRDIQADVSLALARKPRRITGVWIIAMTAFGTRPASVDFRRISAIDARGEHRPIFPA